jgi:cell division protein FtsQ
MKPTKQARQPVAWSQWLQGAGVVALLLVLIASVAYLQQVQTLPIRHVQVEGSFEHEMKQKLTEAVMPYVSGGFMDVNVDSIKQAGEGLPWVKDVQVRRVWPDTIKLTVTEHQAVAYWNDKGLVNTEGQVFYPPKQSFPQGLIQLNGPEGASEMMVRKLIALQQQVTPLQLRVTALSMNQRHAWETSFNDGIRLILGRAKTEQRMNRFVTAFSDALARFKPLISVVDMRYPNGFAVTWKSGDEPQFDGTV